MVVQKRAFNVRVGTLCIARKTVAYEPQPIRSSIWYSVMLGLGVVIVLLMMMPRELHCTSK